MSESTETQDEEASNKPWGWLIRLTGSTKGTVIALHQPTFLIGRSSSCNLIVEGERAIAVSGKHAEFVWVDDQPAVRDLDSTNGTFVNKDKVTQELLKEDDEVMLGPGGPCFRFCMHEPTEADISKTMRVDRTAATAMHTVPEDREGKKKSGSDKHETLLREAVHKAREARSTGQVGTTEIIMRAMLSEAVVRSRKPLKLALLVSILVLVVVSIAFWVTIKNLQNQKTKVDTQILMIEKKLEEADDPETVGALLQELDGYQKRALDIQKNLLYQLGVRDEEMDFIELQVHEILKDFGAETYSVPPEFLERVRAYVDRHTTRDRRNMERVLIHRRQDFEDIRDILREYNLPPALSYMVLVETGFQFKRKSHAGAAGPWQFLPRTARAYGLTVNKESDERYDVKKSTHAASRYIRDLILEFGSGSSVMLALAAYNTGPTRVKRTIRKMDDPIKERNFWHLYRVKALPRETREYVPKIVAAIIVGRHPERFGFVPAEGS